jgi:hypothetical protein
MMHFRCRTAYVALIFFGAGVAALTGCAPEKTQEASAPPAPPPVKITAYINVSSGCQQPTIDLLQGFEGQYPGRVSLELVDFGDEGRGNKRWKDSGHDCMTIEIDGSALPKFDTRTGPKTVALRQPVGFWWTHDDLEAAVAAAVARKLQRGTEEEAIAGQPPRKVRAEIVTEEVKRDGQASARVLINERSAMLFRTSSTAGSPIERADAAAEVLRQWLKGPIKPSEIDRKEVSGGWAVRVGKQVVAVATVADAKAANGTPDQLAKKWLVGIRQGIAIAARPPGVGETATKEAPKEDGCETGG